MAKINSQLEIASALSKWGTAANWTATNHVLRLGEIGVETDTKKKKTGDGRSAWNDLPYDPQTASVNWGEIEDDINLQLDLKSALDDIEFLAMAGL